VPKIISECCELVKLCHIICSGPFFETHCRIVGLPSGKKNDIFSGVHRIPACDRRTSCHSIVRAYAYASRGKNG